jgi:O-antigen/teichoic acid export membrane protein
MPEPIQAAAAPIPPPDARATHSNLDRSLLVGVAWTAGVKWGTLVLSWACTLIIARLLSPADYGLFGMAMVIQGFVGTIYDFGLEDTIVRQRDLTDDQVARLGGLALLYGVIFALLTVAIAEPIARFYREPAVEWLLQVLALTTIIEAVQMLPRASLARQLRFRTLAWIDGAAGLSLGLGTLLFALAGFRYQALAYSAVTSGAIAAVVAFVVAPQRLALPRRHSGLRPAMAFGIQVVLARIAWYAYTHADFAVISRVLGKAALGAYTFAWALATLPADRFAALVGNVMRGVFSAVQDDKAALRRYWLATTEGLAFVVLPVAVGIAVAADDVILVVLGDQWRGAIAPLRLLAVYGGFRALIAMIPPLLIAAGHARRNLERTLLGVAVLPALFYFGSRWGTIGVAAAWVVGYPLVSLPTYRFTFRLVGLTPRDYFRAVWPALSATLVMAAVVVAAHIAARDWALLARFAMETAAGAATYVALVLTQHRGRIDAFRTLLRSARESAPPPHPE